MSGKIKNLIYLIAAIIIMVIIGTALRSAGIINMKREQETEGERLPWGRDTVKQFYGGIYEISRSSAFYVFHSLDKQYAPNNDFSQSMAGRISGHRRNGQSL